MLVNFFRENFILKDITGIYFKVKKTILVMIDGVGIPGTGWADSVYSEYCRKDFVDLLSEYSIAVDSSMGVSGIPQSATGQTALFTGKNAAAIMGRHIQGFPGPSLRKIIREKNLFAELKAKGLKFVFANAYVQHTMSELIEKGLGSVTTVMSEQTRKKALDLTDLNAGQAVYHDITRKSISHRFDVETITPQQGAIDLIELSRRNDLTLFEYFLTDKAGHKGDKNQLKMALGEFSEFFCNLIDFAKNEIAVILTSDHGNCEAIDDRKHTLNPVPLFVYGLPLPSPEKVDSIEKIYDYIIEQCI